MANDCLVKRLKGVVNNPNLPRLGETTIKMKTNPNYPQLNDFEIHTNGAVNWESNTVLYDGNNQPIGTSGVFNGSVYAKILENVELKVWPKYNIDSINLHNCNNDFPLEDLLPVNTDLTIRINNYSYMDISKVGDPSKLKFAGYGNAVYLPVEKNMNYSNITLADSVVNVSFKNNLYPNSLESYVTPGGDIANILNIDGVAGKLIQINMRVRNLKCTLDAFSVCTNLQQFTIYETPAYGNLVTALTPLTQLEEFNIIRPIKTDLDLADLFNAWKANGKRNSTVSVYCTLPCNGQPLPGPFGTVTFDSNGDWTVS